MSEARIRRSFNAAYRTDKKLKPCSERSAKDLETYRNQLYCAKLLKIVGNSPMKKKYICAALDITVSQFERYKKGVGTYPPDKQDQLERFVAGFINYNLKKT